MEELAASLDEYDKLVIRMNTPRRVLSLSLLIYMFLLCFILIWWLSSSILPSVSVGLFGCLPLLGFVLFFVSNSTLFSVPSVSELVTFTSLIPLCDWRLLPWRAEWWWTMPCAPQRRW